MCVVSYSSVTLILSAGKLEGANNATHPNSVQSELADMAGSFGFSL
jgi:hypothetical protein